VLPASLFLHHKFKQNPHVGFGFRRIDVAWGLSSLYRAGNSAALAMVNSLCDVDSDSENIDSRFYALSNVLR
jgi:hypothetical protein